MEVDVKWLCLLLKVIAVAVDGRLDVNVALNRPSYQVSTYNLKYAYYGNDGNHDTSLHVAPYCSHTAHETNPWWSVDLGTRLKVHSIQFTNRADDGHWRADNFIIGLTDVSPTVTAPTLWNYAVCGQYRGPVVAGATVKMNCTGNMDAYRYLILQFPITDFANFCELEVYIRSWEFRGRPGQKMINKVATTIQVDRQLQCMIKCILSPVCDSYNYRPSDKTCQFNTHSTPLVANSTDIVADSDWTWWNPIFCNIE